MLYALCILRVDMPRTCGGIVELVSVKVKERVEEKPEIGRRLSTSCPRVSAALLH